MRGLTPIPVPSRVDFRELFEKPYRSCCRVHGKDAVIVSVLDGRRDLERALIDPAPGR